MSNMKQINFNDVKELTDQDIEQILKIVGHRCRAKTVNRLESILRYGRHTIPSYGIFHRLIKFEYGWEYVAGQSYPDEIKTLRECILKG